MLGCNIKNKILLGTWCLKNDADVFNRRHMLKIIRYHWDDRGKYNKDYVYLSKLYEKLLAQYAKALNDLHNIERDLRYWRIVIGPWLRFFVDSVFDRYEQVRSVKIIEEVPVATIYSYDVEDWIPYDFAEFYDRLTSDEWNDVLFSECLTYLNMPHILSSRKLSPTKFQVKNKKSILKKLVRINDYFAGRFSTDILLLATTLSYKKVAKIYFSLGQMPYFLTQNLSQKVKNTTRSKRDYLRRAESESESDFEHFIHTMICKYIPEIYIEAFEVSRREILRKSPKNTSVIYTANAYQGDDVFKLWCAEKTYSGARLVIGQHGGNFGCSLVNQTEDHQLKIADAFLSWGWTRTGYFNIVPHSSIKLSNKRIQQCDSGDILHVLACFPRYFHCHYSMPAGGQFLDYLLDQVGFIKLLSEGAKVKLRLRLDSSGEKYENNVKGVLIKAGLSSNVDLSKKSILKRLEGCRVCICTHNATVFLETMANNFPTIIFWDQNIFELRSDAKEKFKILEEVKILHYSNVSAAEMLNEISENVSIWWMSDEVQRARKIFVEQYARNSNNAFKEFNRLLNSQNNTLHHQN